MNKKKTTTVSFSISGEFITNHVRNLWQEGRFSHCLKTLDCVEGLTKEQQEDIIFGRAQLIGINDLQLVSDNWKPGDKEYYPDMQTALVRGEHWNELQRYKEDAAWSYARQNWWESRQSKFSREQFLTKLVSIVGEAKAEHIHNEVMKEFAEDGTNPASYYANVQISQKRNGGTVDEDRGLISKADIYAHAAMQRLYLETGIEMDMKSMPSADVVINRGHNLKPELCPDMSSANGWLLPDGKFYKCGTMEHIGLAANVLKDECPDDQDPETIAENKGWIKLSKSITGFHCFGQNKPTKKQLNKLWDYAQYHNRDYKEMIRYLPK